MPLKSVDNQNIANYVRKLADSHMLNYIESESDKFGNFVAELDGDKVKMDQTSMLLLALYKAEKISVEEMLDLQYLHLLQTKNH